ncbi:adenylate/guanylate cyclase domain-containing protein [Pedobacter nanyangensis]|uniref:adenylate/guanylate cyclase domain-containing protein n=1 Tax=Pedobacter nanyangensis TaxID=1562389 RepID=UPI000DE362AA|nr:adenylate/guanylate cyclase domain-containing protein [Pedobacter nanyangensis]
MEKIRAKNWSYNKKIYNLKELLLIMFLWIGAALLYVFIKINELSETQLTEVYQLQHWVSGVRIYVIAFLMSWLISIPIGIMHLFAYPAITRRSFGFILAIRLLNLLLLIGFALFFYYFFIFDGNIHSFNFSLIISASVYALLTESFITIILLLKRNLGVGFFSDFFTSNYLDPSKEERVFLFLDMIDSTPLVQHLGSYEFSNLMQDCFADLSDAVLEYNGTIYQFVGDEAVIIWKTKDGFRFSNSLDFYYAYLRILESRKDYYIQKYGILPKFRAAVNSGKVTIALVGDIKREIAYYGSVLNICSRIQKLSHSDQNQIIVSESFFEQVQYSKSYSFYALTGLELKGIPDIKTAYVVQPAGFSNPLVLQ